MKFEPKNVALKDGRNAILRSPKVSDASELIEYLKITCSEFGKDNNSNSHFLRLHLYSKLFKDISQVHGAVPYPVQKACAGLQKDCGVGIKAVRQHCRVNLFSIKHIDMPMHGIQLDF